MVHRGQLNLSRENKKTKKIIRKGILKSIERFNPILYEIFADGKRNTTLKKAARAKNKKIAEKEYPIL
jgi:threonyl-tRNA synthetase